MKYETDYLETSFDRTVKSLCEEIDYWQEQAEYYKQQYEQVRGEHIRSMNSHHESLKQSVGQALLLALHTQETPEGDLVIKREDRKLMSKQVKKK